MGASLLPYAPVWSDKCHQQRVQQLSQHNPTSTLNSPIHYLHALPHLTPCSAAANYNGTCPQSYDAPMVGEVLFEPKKACDFSITLQEGPDFFLTSHTQGACQKSLKVYVHTVCIKSENTFTSSMFSSLPALPSIRTRRRAATDEAQAASLPAAGYAGVVASMPGDIPADAVMGGAAVPTLGAPGGLRAANRALGGSPADSAVLEAAKQSNAADVRPVLASLMLAAAAVALVL